MGSPRSGTTFLSQMVNRFFDHHISRDNGTLLRFHGNLAHYEPLTDDGQLARLIHHLFQDHFFQTRLQARGMTLSEEALLARVRTRTYGGLIEAIFSAIAESHGKHHWGYKRASFARVEGRHVNDLFPDARFVHIIRDARDVVLSMRNTPKVLLERSWHFAAADWCDHVETGRRIGKALGPDRYFEVRYEDLMSDPVGLLTAVLRFAGGAEVEPRAARIEAELPTLVKAGNSEKWRRLMPPPALRQVERVAGPLLAELGYPVVNGTLAGASISAPEMAWLHMDRVARNLFTRNISMMIRYRLEVLNGYRRAWFSRQPPVPKGGPTGQSGTSR